MTRPIAPALFLVLVACGAPGGAPIESDARAVGTLRARPCRGDAIDIDVPTARAVPWADLTFTASLATSLAAVANASQPGEPARAWFCGTGAVTCPVGDARVSIAPVLRPRATPTSRADGHLRFLRVTFQDSADGAPLVLRPGSYCEAVDTVRQQVLALTSASAGDVFVSRECDASGLGVEAHATVEMLSWHLPRAGLPASAVALSPAPVGDRRVDLALVDSGVLPAVASSSDVDVSSSFDAVGDAAYHAHGTALAILDRQVAPAARLHDVRALGGGGTAVGAHLAQSLDEALFGPASGDATRPLVLGLSLGWPSQLSAPAALEDEACVTREDPFGEPVRYLLDVARRLDRDGARAVLAVAAAGNQPLKVDPELFPPPHGSPPVPTCTGGSTPRAQPWFMPAEWSAVDTCRADTSSSTRVALAVSAVDDRDRPAGNAMPLESPLVAPGQHVYAAHAAADGTPPAPMCGDGGLPGGVRLPQAFTGSSVAAALVSAAAARAQALRLERELPPLEGPALARLLYLTGVDLCRDVGRLPVRRLDVGRLETALESCPSLLACARAVPGDEPVPESLFEDCAAELVACGLERNDDNGIVLRACASRDGVAWPAGYAATYPMCTTTTTGPGLSVEETCAQELCPFEAVPNRTLLGSIGPQPNSGGCPDCELTVDLGDLQSQLYAEISTNLPVGTKLYDPWVLVQGYTYGGVYKKFYVQVDIGSSYWKPGEIHAVVLDMSAYDLKWATTSNALLTTVVTPGLPVGTDVSALRLVTAP